MDVEDRPATDGHHYEYISEMIAIFMQEHLHGGFGGLALCWASRLTFETEQTSVRETPEACDDTVIERSTVKLYKRLVGKTLL